MLRLYALLLAFFTLPLAAEPLRFASQPHQASVLELYTSQGCSSCPPADAWLSQLVDHPALWESLFSMAFHVDYWDRLGWRDPFADARHSKRQYDYQRSGATRVVYTPGFFLNGREWRGNSEDAWLPDRGLPGAKLSVLVEQGSASVSYAGTDVVVHLALLGFGHTMEVGAGENRSRTLRQDFVVLDWQRHQAPEGLWRGELPRPSPSLSSRGTRQALMVWISEPGGPQPLQAAGGWLD